MDPPSGIVRLFRASDSRLLISVLLVPFRTDRKGGPQWIAWTPDGRYAASTPAPPFLRWRVGTRTVTASAFAAWFHRQQEVLRMAR